MADSSTTRMTGGQALVAQLVREGVTHVFGLPGDQTMHALDAFYDEPSISFVTTRHEQGTTYMADGYARVTGKPGVAFVVPGVGVYNAGAGLATAYAASSPVVFVAGQILRHGIGKNLGLLHEVDDQLDIVRPITDWQQRTLEAEQSKFEVGMSTNYFVVQAQRDLATAENVELQAVLAYRRALVELERLQQTSLSSANITILGR